MTWDQIVTVTPEAAETHPSESQIYLAAGDQAFGEGFIYCNGSRFGQ